MNDCNAEMTVVYAEETAMNKTWGRGGGLQDFLRRSMFNVSRINI